MTLALGKASEPVCRLVWKAMAQWTWNPVKPWHGTCLNLGFRTIGPTPWREQNGAVGDPDSTSSANLSGKKIHGTRKCTWKCTWKCMNMKHVSNCFNLFQHPTLLWHDSEAKTAGEMGLTTCQEQWIPATHSMTHLQADLHNKRPCFLSSGIRAVPCWKNHPHESERDPSVPYSFEKDEKNRWNWKHLSAIWCTRIWQWKKTLQAGHVLHATTRCWRKA